MNCIKMRKFLCDILFRHFLINRMRQSVQQRKLFRCCTDCRQGFIRNGENNEDCIRKCKKLLKQDSSLLENAKNKI